MARLVVNTAWVTGATGFWGRNVTLSLLRLGWRVVALTRTEPTELLAWAESQQQQCNWVAFDLRSPDWQAIAALDPPQALFHCAIAWDETIEPLLQPNIATPIHLIDTTLTQMQTVGNGRVGVFLGQNGRLGLPGLGHFSATQAALWTWAEAKSRELKVLGVRGQGIGHEEGIGSQVSGARETPGTQALKPETWNLESKICLSLVFPPRAPSDLQANLAARLSKPPTIKQPPNADRLVQGVLQGKRRVGRRPWLAALATLVW